MPPRGDSTLEGEPEPEESGGGVNPYAAAFGGLGLLAAGLVFAGRRRQ